jgi:hypothetical protein
MILLLCSVGAIEKSFWNVCFDANGHLEFGLKCAVQTKPGLGVSGDPCSDILSLSKKKLDG